MKITSVVMTARWATRRRAASKARSVASPKRCVARSSWAKACTVRTASSVSPPSDTMSAMRAWASRDSRADLAAEQDDGRHHQRHHGQHQQGELGIGDHQHGDAAHAHQRVAQRHRGRRADHLLDELGVGRDPAHDVARALDLEPGRPQPHDMGEQVARAGRPPRARPATTPGRSARPRRSPAPRRRRSARPGHSSGCPAGPGRSRGRSGPAGRRRRPARCRPRSAAKQTARTVRPR